jgi:RNA polymerase sigma-70 factor (ECF subfamily)
MTLTAQSLENLDDQAVITHALNQTPGAFDVLVKRYLKQVYSYVFHTVQNKELAEDITQETFLKAYRALGQFDKTRNFKPWLFAIATNAGRSMLKKNQRNPILLNTEPGKPDLFENIEDSHPLEETIHDERLEDQVADALEQLNPSVRQALILRHVEDLSYEDIAQTMGANLNTVRTWLKRGRENMKQLLETAGGLF